ncbi:hypothetical protein [Megasphaera vaginalis (ex Srinivasan et al. 2021)]|nr:hypothetical protein [Megasphaera vaginalis (ex Srinivasan et al. 2021)]
MTEKNQVLVGDMLLTDTRRLLAGEVSFAETENKCGFRQYGQYAEENDILRADSDVVRRQWRSERKGLYETSAFFNYSGEQVYLSERKV